MVAVDDVLSSLMQVRKLQVVVAVVQDGVLGQFVSDLSVTSSLPVPLSQRTHSLQAVHSRRPVLLADNL